MQTEQNDGKVDFLTQCLLAVSAVVGRANQTLILACQERLNQVGKLAVYSPGCVGLDRRYKLSKWMRAFQIGSHNADTSTSTSSVRGYGGSSIVR